MATRKGNGAQARRVGYVLLASGLLFAGAAVVLLLNGDLRLAGYGAVVAAVIDFGMGLWFLRRGEAGTP